MGYNSIADIVGPSSFI